MRPTAMHMTRICLAAAVIASFALTGCTMAPRYDRPDLPVDAAWPESTRLTDEQRDAADAAANRVWRAFFKDGTVVSLVETALANNRDLRVAMLNIERVRAQYWIQRADLLPTINAAGSASNQYLNKAVSQRGEAVISRQYQATVGFTAFELDLFGRIRSLKESALQQFFATEEAAKSAQVTLVAEVVNAYLNLTAQKELLALARSTYQNRQESYDLIKRMFDMGLTSQLTVNQARTIVEEARVASAQFETNVGQAENVLVLLLGAPVPEGLHLAENMREIEMIPDLPPGLPSDLMQRRPDIMAAEHRLMAMNANIGAARANFFPSISITAALGSIAPQYHDLFSRGAGTWLFEPRAVLPIFDSGRNYATLKMSEADRDMAVATYEKSIQTAFREVADALVQRATIGEQLEAQKALVDATEATYTLSQNRYEIGLDSFINVLDAQRSLFSARQGMINTVLLRETNALNLYKALGGGWE
ncbi:putative efflux pump outer membrane protein TtgC [uncultured delta proteobacterium]|uniref:Putative efflux pump outer membrane protein TtgC n=1 Tax=uncultured delta proteobacterium TaxID=34034 RepID=A0A212IWH7_9DELT|nr:putative efflux pump outer membrane protein TtgC [uncultured delta proteobacterium]